MKKVLVGLSGGVDSAVSAYLLQQQGYEVVGGFMKNYIDEDNPNCTTKQDAQEAIKVAKFLGIELISFDFVQEYEKRIISYIYSSYAQGITPNPDILCNSLVKFDLFLERALELGCDLIATGHYARIQKQEAIYQLLRGKDYNKDQSYFLSGLNQYQLSKSLFPLGELTKPEVREIAHKIGLPNAERKDSQGLCFIGNVKIRTFLIQRLKKKEGDIVLTDGTVVGKHQGAYFFTIGQSRGLDINKKAYVCKIDTAKNQLIVSYDKQDPLLYQKNIPLNNWHWICGKENAPQLSSPLPCIAKIRYRHDPEPALLKQGDNKEVIISFDQAQRSIAPGQSIVTYDGDICLGGGIIS